MNEQEIKKPTPKIFLVEDDIRLGDLVKISGVVSSSDQQEKPEEDAKPINVEKLIEQEIDRLSDEDIRGEWDTPTQRDEVPQEEAVRHSTLIHHTARPAGRM